MANTSILKLLHRNIWKVEMLDVNKFHIYLKS